MILPDTALVDTAVPALALGGPSDLKGARIRILEAGADGRQSAFAAADGV
ncbi:MAG: hypothetical protein LBK59_09425 [Bifidobacteriaceae bacterium]|nr:hypothetical protein [Bifidobacteriaceae bacterium]